MKRIPLYSAVLACMIITLFFGSEAVFGQETTVLAREDVVALTKPSVVRIGQRVKGTATIPALFIDFKNQSVAIDSSRPVQSVPVDETISGSGFIVSSDGYIVTNSHVVSLQTTKIDVMSSVVLPAMYDSGLALSEEDANNFFKDADAAFEFSKRVFEFASQHSTFDVKQEIAVFDPASQKEKFDELMIEGFPVQTVSVNDNFYEDEKDVALIKIDRQDLPTLPLGTSQDLNVGKQVSIFGFPATAEFNQRNPLESTFTQGVISALKDSEKKEFKVFQTDAKVSEGSSGGPLIDDTGTVLGIVTFQTDQMATNSGDNFAFSLPIELVNTMIEENHVNILPSSYRERFMQGLTALRAKHCVDAVRIFDDAQKMTTSLDMSRYIAPYRARCEMLMASGQSIDTISSRINAFMERISPSAWLVTGIVMLFGFSLSFVIWWLIREVNKEEREIHVLEARLHKEEEQIYEDHKMIERLTKKKKR